MTLPDGVYAFPGRCPTCGLDLVHADYLEGLSLYWCPSGCEVDPDDDRVNLSVRENIRFQRCELNKDDSNEIMSR